MNLPRHPQEKSRCISSLGQFVICDVNKAIYFFPWRQFVISTLSPSDNDLSFSKHQQIEISVSLSEENNVFQAKY